jgi:omega-6 fatty acid desaturase (delta-12 desaturase)
LPSTTTPKELRQILSPYLAPDHRRSVFEVLITVIPFALLWGLAFASAMHGWWWGLLLTIPAAGFLVRLFMIQHDCGHHAFFREAKANAWVGRLIGVLTMTPYEYWRRTHAIHHATSGNLDRRGLGAIETLTVDEYRRLSWSRRLAYRLYRHPLVMLGLGPAYMFILQHRLPIGLMKERWAWWSVIGNLVGIALLAAPLVLLGGGAFLMVQAPIMVLAASCGVALFYVQHQFEGAYWSRNAAWTLHDAALRGSSQLELPRLLRWFTANIGDHHVHHLASRIPFYRLPQVVREQPRLAAATRLTLRDGLSALRLTLWDEAAGRLVPFPRAAGRFADEPRTRPG